MFLDVVPSKGVEGGGRNEQRRIAKRQDHVGRRSLSQPATRRPERDLLPTPNQRYHPYSVQPKIVSGLLGLVGCVAVWNHFLSVCQRCISILLQTINIKIKNVNCRSMMGPGVYGQHQRL